MPKDMKSEVTLDAGILTDLRCGECGGQLNMTPLVTSGMLLCRGKSGWLLSCPRGSCERFNVKYHAPLLPLIKYEEPT